MKIFRFFIISVILMVVSVFARGQVRDRLQNTLLWINVKDSTNNEPLSFASTYLIADKDTVIYRFDVTDSLGKATLKNIVPGFYSFHVEMLGYGPYVEKIDLRRNAHRSVLLTASADYLDAAKVVSTDQGYYYRGDTLIYRTSAFPVRDGAVLLELVSRLPGAVVEKDGRVYINGKLVEEITVGGKTFFIDNPDRVLRTMPAKFFEQIKVFDKDRNEYSLRNEEKDKTVMDLELKEEYKRGVFGALSLSGGLAADKKGGKNKNSVERDEELYNGKATLSAYNKRDQVTFLGDTRNAEDPAGLYLVSDQNAGSYRKSSLGMNLNTDRIKGNDANIELSVSDQAVDNANSSQKIAFQADAGDINTTSHRNAHTASKGIKSNFIVEKKPGNKDVSMYDAKYRITGSLGYTDNSIVNTSESMYMVGDVRGNVSRSSSVSNDISKKAALNYETRIAPFKGKLKNDKIAFRLGGSYSDKTGESRSVSSTSYSDHSTEDLDFRHDIDAHSVDLNASAEMSHSFCRGVSVVGSLFGSYNESVSDDAAFDPNTNVQDEYYSNSSKNNRLHFDQNLSLDYTIFKMGSRSFSMLGAPGFDFGVNLCEDKNENYTRQHGVENVTGKDEWLLNVAPFAKFHVKVKSINYTLSYSGWSDVPAQGLQTACLDISDPLNIGTGNVYLKTTFNHNASFSVKFAKRKYPDLSFNLTGESTSNPIVSASWYDDKGVSYKIPVNSEHNKRGLRASLKTSYQYSGEYARGRITLSHSVSYSESVSYQAKSQLPGFDKDAFDYSKMMESFWGNPDGNRFYSGESGFANSIRRNRGNTSVASALFYNLSFSISDRFVASNNRTSYSLNKASDINVWNFSNDFSFSLVLCSTWRFCTACNSLFYKGYSDAYKPSTIWNASIVKDFKKFSLSFGISDILNKRRAVKRVETDAYILDSQTSTVGRYAMMGVSFNFGKANARNNDKVHSTGSVFGDD